MTPEPAGKKKMSTLVIVLIVLGVGAGLCCVIGTLAAIAIPNFIKFQARSKQSECKSMVKAAFTAERAYFAEHDKYSENPEELGFSPDGTRSVMLFSVSAAPVGRGPDPDTLATGIRGATGGHLGVEGVCPKCAITIGCGANVDNDPEIDVWSISTDERNLGSGKRISAGQPYNDYNDVTDTAGE